MINPNTDGVTLAEAGETPGQTERVSVKAVGYADDLSAIGKSNQEAKQYAQAMVTMLGCLNIRVQGSKCIYLRSNTAAENDETCEITTEILQTTGLTPRNQGPLTLQNINTDSLLGKRVIIRHRKDTKTPTQEGTITNTDPTGTVTITLPDKSHLSARPCSLSTCPQDTSRYHTNRNGFKWAPKTNGMHTSRTVPKPERKKTR
jgi:hypothetical protein